MRGSELTRQSGIPNEVLLLGKLIEMGELCRSTGLSLADVSRFPSELLGRLSVAASAIRDFVSSTEPAN